MQRLFGILCAIMLNATVVGCASRSDVSQVPPDPYRQQIDALAKPYIESKSIVGMSVGVITPSGRYTYHFGGVARDGAPPNDDTLYEIGSITKTMTGLLLADGVVRGRYTLDTPVQDLLAGKAEVDRRITLRHLSMHLSGLPRLPGNIYPMDRTNPYRAYGEASLLAYLADPQATHEPGTRAMYSNLGVGLLGFALAQDAGVDYETLLKARVFEPLGMRSSTVRLDEQQAARMARPHNADAEPDHVWDFDALAGAGAVRSDIRDMLTYAAAQMRPERTPIAEAIRLSQQNHQREGEASFDNPMGLGWFILDDGDTLTHNGQTGGYKSRIYLCPVRHTAVVVLSNTASDQVEAFAKQLREFVMLGKAVEPARLSRPASVPVQILDRYLGRYVLFGAGLIDVTRTIDFTPGVNAFIGVLGPRIAAWRMTPSFARPPTYRFKS